jgi:hypothetical protein
VAIGIGVASIVGDTVIEGDDVGTGTVGSEEDTHPAIETAAISRKAKAAPDTRQGKTCIRSHIPNLY